MVGKLVIDMSGFPIAEVHARPGLDSHAIPLWVKMHHHGVKSPVTSPKSAQPRQALPPDRRAFPAKIIGHPVGMGLKNLNVGVTITHISLCRTYPSLQIACQYLIFYRQMPIFPAFHKKSHPKVAGKDDGTS